MSMQDAFDTADAVEAPEPDMSILESDRAAAPDFPLDVFGPLADLVQDLARAKSAAVDYVAAALLTVAGGLLGNHRWVQAGPEWKEPPVLFMALVGPPSSGKSPALDALMAPLQDIQRDRMPAFEERMRAFEANRLAAEARHDAWEKEVKDAVKSGVEAPPMPLDAEIPEAPRRPRLYIKDVTVESVADIAAHEFRGVMGLYDELAEWFGSLGRYNGADTADRAFWLAAFGGREHTVDRKGSKDPLVVPRTSIPLLGCIQPDRLESLLLKGDDDGLVSRFLFVFPDGVPLERVTYGPDVDRLHKLLRRLDALQPITDEHGAPTPMLVPLSPDAEASHFAFRQEAKANAEELEGFLAGSWGKGPGLVARIALILHYLNWAADGARGQEPTEISAASMEAAVRLFRDYFMPMAIRTLGRESKAERGPRALARYILRQRVDVIELRELRRGGAVPGLRASQDFDRVAEALVDAGWLIPPLHGAPGRTPKRYAVNPRVHNQTS